VKRAWVASGRRRARIRKFYPNFTKTDSDTGMLQIEPESYYTQVIILKFPYLPVLLSMIITVLNRLKLGGA
jgi:hypothetical protein